VVLGVGECRYCWVDAEGHMQCEVNRRGSTAGAVGKECEGKV
jgi:hypothetical protein